MEQSNFEKRIKASEYIHRAKADPDHEHHEQIKRDAERKLDNFQRFMSIFGLVNTILLTIFIVLRACDVITWNWIWVLSPFWIPLLFALVGILLVRVIFKK